MNERKTVRTKDKVNSQGPKILVAGGAGFVGSFLCRNLLFQNCEVFCLDNFSTGKKENIDDLLTNDRFHLIKYDINEPLTKLDLPDFDYIFHLAGLDYSPKKKLLTLKNTLVNSSGTKNLLDLAVNNKAKFLLGSSINVFEGFISQNKLVDYFGQERGELYSLNEAKRFSENLTFQYFQNYQLNARIVRLGDIYGPRMNLDRGGIISQVFSQIQDKQTLKIPNKGETVVYPTFVEDIVYGLLKAMFLQESGGEIFTLISDQKITVSELVHLIRERVDQEISIEYIEAKETRETNLEKETEQSQRFLNWKSKTPLKEGIKKTIDWLQSKIEEFEKNKPKKKKKQKEEKKEDKQVNQQTDKEPEENKNREEKGSKKISIKLKLFFIFLSTVVFLFFFPFILFGFYFINGLETFDKALSAFKNQEIIVASRKGAKAKILFQKGKKITFALTEIAPFLNKSQTIEELLDFYDMVIPIGESFEKYESLAVNLEDLKSIIFSQKQLNSEETINEIFLSIEYIREKTNILLAEIEKNKDFSSKLFNKRLGDVKDSKKQIEELNSELGKMSVFVNILPEVIGLKEKKSYLVLFQDNLELRPTGGFISSFGLLTFYQGKILDFQVEDVYLADNQLTGKIEPPSEIKKYLGEKNWYLRDSNWDPNFPSSAVQAQWFISKELNKKTDGVFALTWEAIKQLLTIVGSVKVESFGEEITADNLLERVIQNSKITFSSDLKEQGDFMGKVGEAIFEKLKETDKEQSFKLMLAMGESLNKKDVLISLNQTELMRVVKDNGWSGSLRMILPQSIYSKISNNYPFTDFLMPVEANLGVNKTNFYIKRNIYHLVNILKDGELEETVRLVWENNSPSASWPGGQYKDYLRILIPENSRLIKVKEGPDENKLNLVNGEKIDISQQNAKEVIGFYTEVQPGEKKVLEITYRLSAKLAFTDRKAYYVFYIQKQPGIGESPLFLQVNYPENFKLAKITPEGKIQKNMVFFQTQFNEDKVFAFQFVK